MKLKCQHCSSERATLHITEINEDDYAEVHLCYKCAQKYLHESADEPVEKKKALEAAIGDAVSTAVCPQCSTNFEEFRGSGRLGCPFDYEVFREELRPLLENIHGGVRHIGKLPRRLPADARVQSELRQLRQQMQQAIATEDYELAADMRDRIDALERSLGAEP